MLISITQINTTIRFPLTFLLETGGGNCQTVPTFITLLRMKNIPARYVRTWQHTWAEFFLRNFLVKSTFDPTLACWK